MGAEWVSDRPMRRWLVVVAGVVMQAMLGVVMAWSVFRDPLAEAFGWTVSEITLAFTLNYLAFGFSAFVGGLWLPRVGPRTVALTAALLYGLGFALASLSAHQLWVLYLSFGLVGGVGRGLGYIVPVAVLVKWFPDRRGLATGLAAAGFAAGAVVGAPVLETCIGSIGVLWTFAVIGGSSLVVVGGAAILLPSPPPGYRPSGWQPSATPRDAAEDYTLGEALRTPQWYALWAQIFLSGAVGLALVSQAAPMAQEITGIGSAAAAALIGGVALGNLIGRFCWACLSDAVGRRAVFTAIVLVEGIACFLLPYATEPATFGAVAFLVLFSFGGGLGAMPAFAADFLGRRMWGRSSA
jgi:MFS transporter, OFA family, oxalate/formate antiporter